MELSSPLNLIKLFQFFYQLPPPLKKSQRNFINLKNTFGTLPLTVQYLCDLQDAMPCHWSPSISHPVIPREGEDFPRGGKFPKDASLPTFLAYL